MGLTIAPSLLGELNFAEVSFSVKQTETAGAPWGPLTPEKKKMRRRLAF